MGDELLIAILHNDIETALFETGDLLKARAFEQLENTWIRAASMVGECVGLDTVAEYQTVLAALGAVVGTPDEIDVRDAFLCTTRIAVLAGRFTTLYVRPPMQKLKDKITALFPEQGQLSEKGMVMYKSLLPSGDESAERAFVIRILAGLAKMWGDQEYDNTRIALEYLSRKKLAIPKPKWITASSPSSALDDHDIVWILWGAMLLFTHQKNEMIATSFRLFCTNYKKQAKVERYGLLWSAFYHLSCSYKPSPPDNIPDAWSQKECTLYRHVSTNIGMLWNQIEPPPAAATTTSGAGAAISWMEYMPRGSVCRVTQVPDVKEELRLLKVKDSKDEASRAVARHRRFHSGE